MNSKLKKDDSEKKKAEYKRKYMQNHKVLCIHLDKKEDKAIISWLEKQDNRSEAVRRKLRETIG